MMPTAATRAASRITLSRNPEHSEETRLTATTMTPRRRRKN